MIWGRERYIAHSLFEDTGREMFCELFGPLHILEQEWRRQGVSEAEISMKAFDWDFVPVAHLAGSTKARTGMSPRILEDNSDLPSDFSEILQSQIQTVDPYFPFSPFQ